MISKKSLDLLVELSKQEFKCPYIPRCCEGEKYNQCYNHAHVLCIEFEKYYVAECEKRTPKDLNT